MNTAGGMADRFENDGDAYYLQVLLARLMKLGTQHASEILDLFIQRKTQKPIFELASDTDDELIIAANSVRMVIPSNSGRLVIRSVEDQPRSRQPERSSSSVVRYEQWQPSSTSRRGYPETYRREVESSSQKIYITFSADSRLSAGHFRTYFQSCYGPVEDVSIPGDRQQKRYGFVTFRNPETVNKILADLSLHKKHRIDGVHIDVKPYQEKRRWN